MAGTSVLARRELLRGDQVVANYGRQSHGKERAINDQLLDGLRVLIDLGIAEDQILDFSDDVSASGFGTRPRQGWPELVEMIRHGRVGLVTVWETSRGDRQMTPWSMFLDLCREFKVLILAHEDGTLYDPNVARDYEELLQQGVRNTMEPFKISSRSTDGTRRSADKGRPHGRIAYGYRRVYDEKTGAFLRQEPDDRVYQTAEGVAYVPAYVMLWIYQEFAKGVGAGEICRQLNDLGIPSPYRHAYEQRGGKMKPERVADQLWRQSPLMKMITKKAYIGVREHNGREIPDAWMPLIDDETYWTVVNIASNPSRRTSRGGAKAVWLLSCIAKCSVCRSDLVPAGGTYRCSAKKSREATRHATMATHKLERYVEGVVIAFLSSPETAARSTRDSGVRDREASFQRAKAARMRAELADIERAAKDPNDEITRWSDYLEAAKQFLPEIERAERTAALCGIPQDIREWVGPQAMLTWENADVARKRRVIRAVCEIVVYPGKTTKHVPAIDRTEVRFTI